MIKLKHAGIIPVVVGLWAGYLVVSAATGV